jgi:5-formyltetrahydrofolate cyclo-ligase
MEASSVLLKQQLRRELRAQRDALSEVSWAEQSQAACTQVAEFSWLSNARRVALFEPLVLRREVDVRPLAATLSARGVALYYPRVSAFESDGASGEFRRVLSANDFVLGPFGLREPAAHCPIAAEGELDVIVVPCLAVDEQGYRLGYGSGFYDRALARFASSTRSMAVAFSFQCVPCVPRDLHDVACDAVVTELGVRVLR